MSEERQAEPGPRPAPERADDSTTSAGSAADDRTRQIDGAVPLSPDDADRRLASELARRGVPPEEVERLLALGRESAPAPTTARPAAPSASPPLPPSEAITPHPTITLPEFRVSTASEASEADRLLTAAHVAKRRGNFVEAESRCRAAVDLTPRDAAALELYGDILQAMGRVDDALYAYGRAKEADPKRRSSEKRYAELMLLQNREIEILRHEYVPRNPYVAVVLSALFPGAGQVYNGQSLKGLGIAVSMLVCVFILGWTRWGFPGARGTVPTSLALLLLLTAAIYIVAVVDANLAARLGARAERSGWDV